MIRAPLACLGLAALLCAVSPPALAQQPQQQRSRTTTEPKQPTSQPSQQKAAPTQQKPAAKSSTPKSGTAAKPGANGKAAASGQAKPGATAPAPGGGQATVLAMSGDWGAYTSGQGKAKVCYALSQPKDRQPKDLKRDPAYLFVSFRPADNVRNEVAIVMGFATKENGPAEAVVGTASYALLTKGTNAWIRNPAEEAQVIATMSKGRDLVVKATSGRGNASTDRYSLTGFAQALDRARKECS